MKYYDKNQTEINIGDTITNGKEEREIIDMNGVIIAAKYENGRQVSGIVMSKMNLKEWEVVK